MRNFAYALATTACLIVGPAVAGSATGANAAPIVLAQAPGISIDVGGDRGRGGVVVQERDRYDRGRGVVVEERNRGFDRGRDRVVVRRAPACRMITTRTRMPSGRIVIRETRRCV
ncbi:MAG: hypothetical protein QOD40_2321 [Alphaproteobacteria bacterium]|jgi:hypothetical protein|nr:hypothetical protein [Alphaproteobacteria bacterium]